MRGDEAYLAVDRMLDRLERSYAHVGRELEVTRLHVSALRARQREVAERGDPVVDPVVLAKAIMAALEDQIAKSDATLVGFGAVMKRVCLDLGLAEMAKVPVPRLTRGERASLADARFERGL